MNFEIQQPGRIIVTSVKHLNNSVLNDTAQLCKNILLYLVSYSQYGETFDQVVLARSLLFLVPLLFQKRIRVQRDGTFKFPRSESKPVLEWALFTGYFPQFAMSDFLRINLRGEATRGTYLRELQRFNSSALGEIICGRPELLFQGPGDLCERICNIHRVLRADLIRLSVDDAMVRNIFMAAHIWGHFVDSVLLDDPTHSANPDPSVAHAFNTIHYKAHRMGIWRTTILCNACQLLSPEEFLSGSLIQQELHS
ncbi:putative protein P0 [Ixeridium yellow mottle virus 1]|uniref:putative protein P0 n=1 Tax=Ixeridium yellow mottle virus 1 TaxID=1809767 RepID=UPI00078427F3|nr:putative protein P0 [Ixeridium yellow mottle virus 1]AMQ22787.1 putative protein P0 [Ixeridium yellow mottle virus 1]